MPLLVSAFLLGVAAGSRAALAPAAVAWAAAAGRLPLDGTWAAFAARPLVRWATLLAALGELVVDKLPMTPSRKLAGPFAGRLVSGGLSGAVLGTAGGSVVTGAVAGVAGAVVGTLGGYAFRRRLAQAFGRDLPAALVEDALAIALAAVALLGADLRP